MPSPRSRASGPFYFHHALVRGWPDLVCSVVPLLQDPRTQNPLIRAARARPAHKSGKLTRERPRWEGPIKNGCLRLRCPRPDSPNPTGGSTPVDVGNPDPGHTGPRTHRGDAQSSRAGQTVQIRDDHAHGCWAPGPTRSWRPRGTDGHDELPSFPQVIEIPTWYSGVQGSPDRPRGTAGP